MTHDLPVLSTFALPQIRQRYGRTSPFGCPPSVNPAAFGCRRLVDAWRGLCSIACIVSRSEKLSALALVVALVVATGSTLIAQVGQPGACVMTHHACDHFAKVTLSCCHAGDPSQQGEPTGFRVQLTVNLSSHPAEVPAEMSADSSVISLRIHTSPRSVCPPDFATRFAPLLI